jgi:hypothetical protein
MSVVTTGVFSASGFPPVDHMAAPISAPGSRPRPPRGEEGQIAMAVTHGANGSARVR